VLYCIGLNHNYLAKKSRHFFHKAILGILFFFVINLCAFVFLS